MNAEGPMAGPVRAGFGSLAVRVVAGQSTVTTAIAASPLKLLIPRSRGASVWACTSSFGGGLVAGDQTALRLDLAEGSRCYLGTQASTKIYRNPGQAPCGHQTRAIVGPGAVLVFAPDPVQPFADSSYIQRQEFHLAAGASLVLLDWFSAGRTARGERWQFQRFRSRNAVYLRRDGTSAGDGLSTADPTVGDAGAGAGSKLAFLDSLALDAADGPLTSCHRTGRFNCFAMVLLLGPAVSSLAETLLASVRSRPIERASALLAAASPVGDGVVLRLAGEAVEKVGTEVRRTLAPLATLLGDEPWARKG